jgi:hypothetical protein
MRGWLDGEAMTVGEERRRLAEAARGDKAWRQFGPYLAERQWGTVREDYSAGGDAWGSFPHEHARSRAYRWGEDGLLGICDDQGFLCFALALWNDHGAAHRTCPDHRCTRRCLVAG